MQLLILISAAVAITVFFWFLTTPPAQLARQLRILAITALWGLAIFSLVRGAISLALTFATLAVGLMLRSNWTRQPHSPSRDATAPPYSGRTSRVRTAHLDMELNIDSGAIKGQVLKGTFIGRDVTSMTPAELALLWQDCRFEDPQSAQILETYLDRIYANWRDDLAGEETEVGSEQKMSTDEAYNILGLEPGASPQDVRRAHRELMKKLHPDRGGSSYLAAKINEAKDILLLGR